MRLTRETEHAIEALTYLAGQSPGAIVEASALADAVSVPRPFMSKIMQRLAKAELVRGHRGKQRGYSLGASPRRITLRRVLEAMEGEDLFARCIFFSEECSDVDSCPLHGVWKKVRPMMRTMVNDLTVYDLAARK